MRKTFFIFLFLSFLSGSCLQADSLSYPVYPLKGKIQIDGILDEPIWRVLPEATGFHVLGEQRYAPKQSSFKITYDQDNLYFGIVAAEGFIDKLKVSAGEVWNDDSFEIFLLPGPDFFSQFIVNAAGSRWNGRGNKMPLLDWEAKVHKGPFFYSLEMRIPFKILEKAVVSEDVWRVNIGRNVFTSPDRYSTWSYIDRENFNTPEQFRKIIFRKGWPSDTEQETVEQKLNGPFLEYQKKNLWPILEKTAAKYPEYKDEIAKMGSVPEMKSEATALQEDWENLVKLTTRKIFPALEKVEGYQLLLKRTEELRERFQILQLF